MKRCISLALTFLLMNVGCGRGQSKKERSQEALKQNSPVTPDDSLDGLNMVEAPLVNLAFGKKAYQSSEAWNAPASRAVDGNADGIFWAGSVTHTNFEAEPYLEIDLGADMVVNKVTIFNRSDCCLERLNNYELSLRNNGQQVVHSERKRVIPRPADTIDFGKKVARYVRIQLKEQMGILSLAEVQVWGYASPAGKLISGFNNLCLDIMGASQQDDAPLIQYLCHRGLNQKFDLQAVADKNRYAIKNLLSGKCLAVSSFDKGAGVIQKPCGSSGSYFKITDKSGDLYKIKEFVSGKCLEVPNRSYAGGQQIRIANCNNSDEQRFRITD